MSKLATIRFYVNRVGVLGCLIELMHREGLYPNKWYDNSKLLTVRRNKYCKRYLKKNIEEQEKALREFLAFGGQTMRVPPQTLNEKIQWLKIHGDLELYTMLADKWKVRKWVAEKIGQKYLIPCVGGPWISENDVDFDRLPDRYVLKANHGSGMNLIVLKNAELDKQKTRKIMKKWLSEIYGCYTMEPQYWGQERCIYAEEYMEENDGNLMDYKIFCFNGKPEYIQCIGDRKKGGRQVMYDLSWTRKSFNDDYDDYPEYEYELPKPENYQEMLMVAEKLSEGIPFVRVDLYEINGSIYFGEMTLTPVGGCEKWKNESINLMLGEKISLD